MFGKLLIGTVLVGMASPAFAQIAGWQEGSITDALTGKKITAIVLYPTSDADNEFNQTGIVISCKDDKLSFEVSWDQKMTSDPNLDTYELDYRSGNNDVQTGRWNLTTDNQGFLYPGNVYDFIQNLEGQSVFVAQVIPTGMAPINATYDLTGLNVAVVPVLTSCGY